MFSRRLHAYLRALAGPRAHRVGPFLASFDDQDAGLFRNYAVPDDGVESTSSQVTALITAFTDRDRIPRLEFLPDLCPAVEAALLGEGFVAERRLPVLTCQPTDAAAPPIVAGIELGLASDDEQLRQVAEAQNEAYGQRRPVKMPCYFALSASAPHLCRVPCGRLPPTASTRGADSSICPGFLGVVGCGEATALAPGMTSA